DEFKHGKPYSKGHYGAICQYCTQGRWQCRKPAIMESYLALHCKGDIRPVPDNVRQKWLIYVAKRNEKTKDNDDSDNESLLSKRSKTSHTDFNLFEPISNERNHELNKALIKAFVCAEISFSVINNPFVRDLFKLMVSGYTPPGRLTLASNIFDEEAARVTVRVG
ncbi:7481_t:CDS:1, partial [Racocetra fulgida]